MTRKLEGLDERPEDFDLTNYRPLKELSLIRWYEQVSERYVLEWNLRKNPDVPQEVLRSAADKLMRHPIVPPSNSAEAFIKPLGAESEDKGFAGRQHTSLGSMTLWEAQNIARWIVGEGRELPIVVTPEDVKDTRHQVFDDAHERSETKWTTPSMATLLVNLDSPPDVLDKEFKAWRLAAQAKNEIKFAGYKIDPRVWCRDQLLPFIDLNFWAHLHGGKLTDNALAEMLFPTIPGRSRYIVKTVRPASNRLMSKRMLDRLHQYACREAMSNEMPSDDVSD